MCKLRLGVGVIITLLQIQLASGDLSIDQKIREGNRRRELDVRLVHGASMLEGRVEIRYNGTWGTICGDQFTSKVAEVVCHMLGYQRLGATPYRQAAYGKRKGPIWLDELKCQGNEISLREYQHLSWGSHNCRHRDDAGVKCQANKQIAEKKDERDKMLTLQLDLVVEEGERHKVFQRNKANHKNAAKYLWRKDISFTFGDGIDDKAKLLIRDALDEWEAFSCLDFSKDAFHNDNYNKIVFTSNQDNKGCATTYIGMKQGSQEIHLGRECLHRDIILHEIGHALGFYHEHNRANRDRFLKVHRENIAKGCRHQFRKLKKEDYEDFDKPYDYKSIMHYGPLFFSRNESQKLITMETLDPEFQDVIGKVKHPSFLDYKILNAMYRCSAECGDVQCPGGGSLGKRCRCYCKGNQDDGPITLCSKENNCPNPFINTFLFDVLDKINETVVDTTLNSYPNNTIFNVFSTNLNCSSVSELRCDNGTWKGRMPDCPVELGIELIDGSDNGGIIELMLNEQRGLICDDNWDDNDATVACRMMGFEFAKAQFVYSSKVNESLPILLDDLKCSGNESTLSECNHNGWGNHDCKRTEVAAVKCFPSVDITQIDVLRKHDCGKIPLKGSKRRKREVRIVGGAEAVKGMYPWQVRIQRMRGRWIHWCGGTIISSHWVLSAAHCFDDLTSTYNGRNAKMNYKDFRVIIGDHDGMKDDEFEQTFHIEYLVKHWQYNERNRINPENDIALLKIDSDSGADFNNYVQPACLPEENVSIDYGMKCEVSGWGKRAESGEIPNILRAVEVPIIEEKECETLYRRYPFDTQRMFCAGTINVGADTCKGDSGGPLVCDIKDRNTVIGITSWGLGCGRRNLPGVYTKVTSFVSWIKRQIALHDFVATAGSCGRPGSVANAVLKSEYRNRERFNDGERVKYTCKVGYTTVGRHRERQCSNGQWSNIRLLICNKKDECAVNNGGCQHICTNIVRSYECACCNGFTLHKNKHDCECQHEITASSGEISSPNWPDFYPSRKDCVWHFFTVNGHRVKIIFENFELEQSQDCSYDHIEIFDGGNNKSTSLGRFCGVEIPYKVVISTGNELYIVFYSDELVERKGFRATHTTVCGGKLEATGRQNQLFSHARYGYQNYDNNLECDWIIQARDGHKIDFYFNVFEIEDETDCGYDNVEVFDGQHDTDALIGRYCGSTLPPDISSTGQFLLVRFRSDDTINWKGFSAVYGRRTRLSAQ